MKLRLLPLLLATSAPVLGAPSGNHCKDLTGIVQHWEKELQKKNVYEVDDEGKLKDQGPCDPLMISKQIGEIHKTMTPEDISRVKENACSSLATLETKIAKLENQQSLLVGFKKLKADLAANKVNSQSEKPAEANLAGLNFVDGLNAAESLEYLLETPGGNMLKVLANTPAKDRDTVKKVKELVKRICADNEKTGICKDGAFRPNQKALAAINELLAKTQINDKVIQDWTRALAIEKKEGKDKKYSFKKMAKDLEAKIGDIGAGKLTLTKQELRAIGQLPDFKDLPLNLSGMKKDLKPFELMQEYKFHVLDLRKRQEYELQSKAVLSFSRVSGIKEVAQKLAANPEGQGACKKAKSNFDLAVACLEVLNGIKDSFPSDERSLFQELYDAATVSRNYLTDLDQKHGACLEVEVTTEFKEKGELPAACIDGLLNVNPELEKIGAELRALIALKDEIGKQNQKIMKVRNFALKRLTEECTPSTTSTLQCEFENTTIKTNLEVLTSDMADLMVFNRQEENFEDDKWLCADKEFRPYGKELLCTPKKKPADPVVIKPDADEYQAPTSAPDGGYSPTRDAAVQGLGYLTGATLSSLFAPRPNFNYVPPYNPYMYNYAPYNYGYPVMSISDEILFGARYYGAYGFYMPTPGLQPYTAFGSGGGISGYQAYSFGNKSSYFSR